MDTDKKSIEQRLQQIADMLILNGTLVDCPGLIHGKTGIAIFFFHYAQYTSNVLYENYALDLIVEMQSQIHNNSPADYETGLAGIGVGIDYLLSNHFLEVDDDFFEDFDKRMVRAVMYDSCQDFTFYNGFAGFGQYWIMRQRRHTSSVQAKDCLLHIAACMEKHFSDFSKEEKTDVYCFLYNLNQLPGFIVSSDIMNLCRNSLADAIRHIKRLGNCTVGKMAQMFLDNHYLISSLSVETECGLDNLPDLKGLNATNSMGLLTGYAGEGMLRLTSLYQTNREWMYLL